MNIGSSLSSQRSRFSLKGNKRLRAIGSFSSVLFTALLLATIVPVYYEPTNTEALTGNPVESVLTFSSINPAASVNLTVNSPDGTFATSTDGTNDTLDQRASFSIATNNYTGYTVSISSSDASGELNYETDSIDTIPSTVTATEFANNSKSGTDLNNTWGYIPNYYDSVINTTNYYPSSTTAATLNSTSAPNSVTGTTNPDTYTIGLGIRADYATQSGTYKNSTIVISYIANTIAYSITYDANDEVEGRSVSNMPTPNPQAGDTDLTSTILSGTIPTRRGYEFKGWCSEATDDETCSGITFQPGDAYGIDQTTDNENSVLYAMWKSPCNKHATTITTNTTKSSTDAICMQDMNDTVMGTMTQGTQYQLMDVRDGKNYYVAKMADGKVWMTQNLDLDLVTDYSIVYSHKNTDLGWTTNDSTATWVPSTATVNTVGGYSSSDYYPRSYDPGDTYYYTNGVTGNTADTAYSGETALADCKAARIAADNTLTDDEAEALCTHYHAGNYYNWSAAVATNNTSSGTGGNANYVTNYYSMPNSICPAGWRLPYGPESATNQYSETNALWVTQGVAANYVTNTSTATYKTTDNIDGFTAIRQNPLYTVRAGYKNSTNAVASAASYGFYATSTAYNSSYSYITYFYSGGLFPRYSGSNIAYRQRGFSVRCVARMSNSGSLTIKYDGNGSNGGTAIQDQVVEGGKYAITQTNTYTKTGSEFAGWNTQADGSGTNYNENSLYDYALAGANSTITLYAKWNPVVTFTAGSNIDTMIIAPKSENYKPYYITTGQSKTVTTTPGAEYLITVVPSSNYILGSWTRDTNAGTISTGNNNEILLTSTYTVGSNGETIIANGVSGSYPSMKDFTLASCTTAGNNVTDARDGKSYTVAKFGDYCYMLSNLRLDGGITLTSADSDINPAGVTYATPDAENKTGATTFTTPTEAWTSTTTSQLYYSKAIMAISNNEYYYNWYAAKANAYVTSNPTSKDSATATIDNYALGSICPAGWTLPNYDTDITPANVWNNGANPGALSTSGYFAYGNQSNVGSYGYWWSSAWSDNNTAYYLYLNSSSVNRNNSNKYFGFSVRCRRSRNLTFKAGSGIDTIIVAPKNENYKPYYINKTNPVLIFENATPGTEYLITVVPESGYILDSWTKNANAGTFSVGSNNEVLLTSTYTSGGANGGDELIVANGVLADNNNKYPVMKDFTLASCTTAGNNVTDARDGKSYTVAKFGDYCYMLSNLRLDGGITLTSADSDIIAGGVVYETADADGKTGATTFTTPTEAWTGSGQDYYSKAIMKVINNEYYYNWYAAKANAYVTSNPTSSSSATETIDNYALGSICPAGWTLPNYDTDITPTNVWNSGANPGALIKSGEYYSNSQSNVGSYAYWWSSTRESRDGYIFYLYLNSSSNVNRGYGGTRSFGRSVRCMRSGS